MSTPTAFHDLPPECFPFTIVAYRKADRAEVWRATVEEPYVALYVPPLADTHGPIGIRIEYADGTVDE